MQTIKSIKSTTKPPKIYDVKSIKKTMQTLKEIKLTTSNCPYLSINGIKIAVTNPKF